jgi:hypothetical protein
VDRSIDPDITTQQRELMNTIMRKRALAARDARLALLDLKKLIDEATRTIHAAELEAVHLAISSQTSGDISYSLQDVLERLGSANFEATLERVRESLQLALS